MKTVKATKHFRFLSIILTFVIILSSGSIVFADSNTVGVVVLDGADIVGGSLKTRVVATGIGDATNVKELHIGSDILGSLNAADIAYINTMGNLEVLDVASTIVVGDVGDGFCSSFTGTEFDNLREVTFPATDFGNNAFRDCYVLVTISLPKAITFGSTAFGGCQALETISLPEATTFGNLAFWSSFVLETISLPKVTSFGDNAFMSCYVAETSSVYARFRETGY